jgi:hypothetical protein
MFLIAKVKAFVEQRVPQYRLVRSLVDFILKPGCPNELQKIRLRIGTNVFRFEKTRSISPEVNVPFEIVVTDDAYVTASCAWADQLIIRNSDGSLVQCYDVSGKDHFEFQGPGPQFTVLAWRHPQGELRFIPQLRDVHTSCYQNQRYHDSNIFGSWQIMQDMFSYYSATNCDLFDVSCIDRLHIYSKSILKRPLVGFDINEDTHKFEFKPLVLRECLELIYATVAQFPLRDPLILKQAVTERCGLPDALSDIVIGFLADWRGSGPVDVSRHWSLGFDSDPSKKMMQVQKQAIFQKAIYMLHVKADEGLCLRWVWKLWRHVDKTVPSLSVPMIFHTDAHRYETNVYSEECFTFDFKGVRVDDNWVEFEWPVDVAYFILKIYGESRPRIYGPNSRLPYRAHGDIIIVPKMSPQMPVAFCNQWIVPPMTLALAPGMEAVITKYKNINNYLINSTDRLLFGTLLKRFVPLASMDMPAKKQVYVWYKYVQSLGS